MVGIVLGYAGICVHCSLQEFGWIPLDIVIF